jgi:Cu+-exporting ATPase
MTLEPLLPIWMKLMKTLNSRILKRFWYLTNHYRSFLAMFGHQLNWFEMQVQSWIELVLTLPIVLWAGMPFFVRCWQSI